MLRILWCGFGLGITVLTVVLVTLFVPIFSKLVSWHNPKGLLAVFLVGGLLCGLVVYPTFAFAAYFRSVKSIASPYYWLWVGAIIALIVNLALAAIFVPYTNFTIFNSSVVAGLAGGFVYSLFDNKQTFSLIQQDVKSILCKLLEWFPVPKPVFRQATA